MAHFRKRHIVSSIQGLLKFSPLLGIFGHRQAGKTTLLEKLVDTYKTFDDKETKMMAEKDAALFLRKLGRPPVGIDECQFVEDLFPALKEQVRKDKKPGQIILSGSVRFYSRQAIRESLTGRIVNIDLLPLTLTELAEDSRALLPLKLIERDTYKQDFNSEMRLSDLKSRSKLIDTYAKMGGLPGICFLRNDKIRNERLREQLQLILDRDLRLIYPTSVSLTQLLDFVKALAEQEGQLFQPTIIRKQTGLAEATQKKILHALEAVFLIRICSVEGDRKGLVVFFEDQAEQQFLLDQVDRHRAFEGLVYRNLRASFAYEMGCDYKVFQYRKRPDVRVPFVIRTKAGCLGVCPILEPSPSRQEIRAAKSFLQKYSPATVLFVTKNQKNTIVLDSRILQIPAERLLFE